MSLQCIMHANIVKSVARHPHPVDCVDSNEWTRHGLGICLSWDSFFTLSHCKKMQNDPGRISNFEGIKEKI